MGTRLPVVFAVSGASIDLVVEAGDDATVDDLVRALAGGDVAAGTELTVDGRRVPSGALVADAGLRAGSRLALDGSAARAAVAAAAEVHVVGGLDAGAVRPLARGHNTIGRSRHADVQLDAPTVSRLHVAVDVDNSGAATVRDAGSTNGTRLGDGFVTGPVALAARDELALGALGAADRARANTAVGARPARSTAHRVQPPTAARHRFSWTGLLVPLVAGGVMAVLWDPRLAAFCLLSPVLVVGTWFEERRRTKRGGRERDLHAELERFGADVASALEREAARRARLCPDPADVVRLATSADTRLWQRRAHEPSHPGIVRVVDIATTATTCGSRWTWPPAARSPSAWPSPALCRSTTPWTSRCVCATRSRTRMRTACRTSTSSRRTCCSAATAACCSPTSVARRAAPPGSPPPRASAAT